MTHPARFARNSFGIDSECVGEGAAQMRTACLRAFACILAIWYASPVFAASALDASTGVKCRPESATHFSAYEPIAFGYTKDSDDVPFADVTLSTKAQLYSSCVSEGKSSRSWATYFTFTDRFGFYFPHTRQDSPVVQKRFNPALMVRVWGSPESFWTPDNADIGEMPDSPNAVKYQSMDFRLAHESNGQPIHTLADYQRYEVALAGDKQGGYVNDYIHRGWDMLGFVYTNPNVLPSRLAGVLDLKFFFPQFPIQGQADEFHPEWEPTAYGATDGKPRRAVDGLTGRTQFFIHGFDTRPWESFANAEVDFEYTTGYMNPFRFSTFRLSLEQARLGEVPFEVWVRSGYMTDLSMYFRKVNELGFAFQFKQLGL